MHFLKSFFRQMLMYASSVCWKLLVLGLILFSVSQGQAQSLCGEVLGENQKLKDWFELSKVISSSPQRPWFEKINFAEIEKRLQNERIISFEKWGQGLARLGKRPLSSDGVSFLVTFESGLMAEAKPGPNAEVEAYAWMKLVKSQLIPPTVRRQFGKKDFTSSVFVNAGGASLRDLIEISDWSLQFFLKTDVDLLAFEDINYRKAILNNAPLKQKMDALVFNFVFGRSPLNWSDVLVDESNSILMRNNESVRRFFDIPPTVNLKKGAQTEARRDSELASIQFLSLTTLVEYAALDYQTLRRLTESPLISDQQIHEILARRDQLIEASKYRTIIP